MRDQLLLLSQARDFTGMPLLPVSWGEVFDKQSILEIKTKRVTEAPKRVHIERELSEVRLVIGSLSRFPELLPTLMDQLKCINETLWDVEDALRQAERSPVFDDASVQLARQVYLSNDRRAGLKREINVLLGSVLQEEKSYPAY